MKRINIKAAHFTGYLFFVLMVSPGHPILSQDAKTLPEVMYQMIDGFGASDAWRAQFVGKNRPIEKRNRIADLLFNQEDDEEGNPKGIGLSIWRFYLSAGTTERGEASDMRYNRKLWMRA